MAKAASPVRLQAELMAAATTAGELLHRSAAEQIEHWAELGRRVAATLSPQAILEITAGVARLRVEPVAAQPVDAEAVFAALERQRGTGELARAVTGAPVRYQASSSRPGLLERIDENGVTVGQFVNGAFVPAGD